MSDQQTYANQRGPNARSAGDAQRTMFAFWVVLGLLVQALITPIHATAPLVHDAKIASDPVYAAYYSLCDQNEQSRLNGEGAAASITCMGCCLTNAQGLACCNGLSTGTMISWPVAKAMPPSDHALRLIRPALPYGSRAPPATS